MSCKSAIYTVNSALPTIPVGGTIPAGTVIRRFGCNINLSGSGITLTGAGYYDVDASITAAPTAAGIVTVTLFKDGVAVPGATASATATAANDNVSLSINSLVRLQCCDDSSTLTLVLTGTESVINNASIVVEKL
ncbi:MAG: hypothetical protein J1F01_08610 [Oscillospiraceae bacterium]|nr:hypothetical protein [Oscillospiraceae bacterium]